MMICLFCSFTLFKFAGRVRSVESENQYLGLLWCDLSEDADMS